MNITNKLAKEAAEKAKSMGWEVRVRYDQSDVLDYATVVAWKPGSDQMRVVRFIEGLEAIRGWRPKKQIDSLLDYQNAL